MRYDVWDITLDAVLNQLSEAVMAPLVRRLRSLGLDRMAVWDKQIATGKEIVTGCIGVLIVVVTLLVAVIAIFSVSNAEARTAAKDVLLFLNGLVGVALGYYSGWVPSESGLIRRRARPRPPAASSTRP